VKRGTELYGSPREAMEDLPKDPKIAGLPMRMSERITNLVANYDQVINRSHGPTF